MAGGFAYTEREVGILDGVLGLVHSGVALGPGPAAQQLHVLLHRLAQLVHFLRDNGNRSQSVPRGSPRP